MKKAEGVLRFVVPRAVSLFVPGTGELIKAAVDAIPLGSQPQKLNEYQEAKKAVREFKEALLELSNQLSESIPNHPLVFAIDELDRCRPSYAVELLEVAKHLFSVNNVVFVLVINQLELAQSVKALYGQTCDAEGYLQRFFDLDFRLPDPDRSRFVDALLYRTEVQLSETKERKRAGFKHISHLAIEEESSALKLLRIFLKSPDLSLRRISQSVH